MLTTAAAQEHWSLPFAEIDAATAHDAEVRGAATVESRLASDCVVGSVDLRWVPIAAVPSLASSGKIDRLAEAFPPCSDGLKTDHR